MHMCTVVLWTKIVVEFMFLRADCSDKEAVGDRQTDMRCESQYVIKMFLLVVLMFLIFECPIQIPVPSSFGISNKVLLGTSD